MATPLEQFEVFPIIQIAPAGAADWLTFSFTNSSFWMLVAVGLIYWLVMSGTRQHALVPGRLQSVVELTYEFVANLLRENAGREGMRFFPLFFTLFTFILAGNLLGLIPGAFTFTSHIIVTFTLAILVVIGVTVLGFVVHGTHFLSFFVPHGAPKAILPLMVPIEVLSYCVRPISLSVRLFVNMMGGHVMLKVFAGFIATLGAYYIVPAIGPLALTVALLGFEILVAFLQAYVFTVLSCLYLHDALHMH